MRLPNDSFGRQGVILITRTKNSHSTHRQSRNTHPTRQQVAPRVTITRNVTDGVPILAKNTFPTLQTLRQGLRNRRHARFRVKKLSKVAVISKHVDSIPQKCSRRRNVLTMANNATRSWLGEISSVPQRSQDASYQTNLANIRDHATHAPVSTPYHAARSHGRKKVHL